MVKPDSTHFPGLDGIRGIAISLVLLHHFGGYLASFFDAGYYGVDLFFVLSGFLITSILIRNPEQSFGTAYKNFIGRRSLRIFPIYYLCLLFLLFINFGQIKSSFLFLATYTWNYAASHWDNNPLFYLWSLSVEEQFYLIWPFIALLLRGRPKALMAITLGIVFLSYAQLSLDLFPVLRSYNYTGLLNRMGSLGLGAAGAILFRNAWIPFFLYQRAWLSGVVFAFLIAAQILPYSLRFPVMGACSLFFVLKSANGSGANTFVQKLFEARVLKFLGKISYGVYIFHVPVGILVGQYFFDPLWGAIPFEKLGRLSILQYHSWVLKLPLYSGVSIAVASLSYYLIESKLLRLKDRWFPTLPKAGSVCFDNGRGCEKVTEHASR